MTLTDQLSYCSDTGIFTWSRNKRGPVKAGDRAGTVNGKGYRQIKINQEVIAEHRLAWWFHYGEWPSDEIDHINGDPLDNRIGNLRIATRQQQCWNSGMKKTNKLGLKGVVRAGNKYKAHIRVNDRPCSLGLFDDENDAHRAYVTASRWCFGEFARAA